MKDPEQPHADLPALMQILEISRKLAQPHELQAVLGQVIDAGRELLSAERGSVFLHYPQTGQLCTTVATGTGQICVRLDQGIVGYCASDRRFPLRRVGHVRQSVHHRCR